MQQSDAPTILGRNIICCMYIVLFAACLVEISLLHNANEASCHSIVVTLWQAKHIKNTNNHALYTLLYSFRRELLIQATQVIHTFIHLPSE